MNDVALLAGIDLTRRWQGRERFVVLDTDFGAGHRFLATWQAWRDDPQHCARLVFIAISPLPWSPSPQADSPSSELADALRLAWPPATADLHRVAFDEGRVELLLAAGDTAGWLREIVADVDAFCLTGDTPIDSLRLSKALGRLAAPGATLAADQREGESDALRAHLTSAGFEVDPARAMTAMTAMTQARFAPRFASRAPSRQRRSQAGDRHALIIGAGLAGCAAASALAEQGWRSTLIEREQRVATGASGNPAGLFHGIVNAQDGIHARFNRAAAFWAREAVQAAIDRGVAGSADGLLRLETGLDLHRMQAMLHKLALPPSYVQALSADEASERAGLALAHLCWFYPGGGWVAPAGLAQAFLSRARGMTELRTGVDVHRLERNSTVWRALDAHGRPIADADAIVLANAGDALRLLDAPGWPIDSVRGQISTVPASRLPAARVPIAGSGYLLPAIGGTVMFGATTQPGDTDATVREADHAANLVQLARLLGHATDLRPDDLAGRTAWRCSASDRLPVIGAVPEPGVMGARLDQPRFVPRVPGLYVFTALGSRGITWSALGARVLAACVTGAPSPVGASLLDAIDPARFVSRQVRRSSLG